MKKTLELNYENRKGLTFKELYDLFSDEIEYCKDKKEKESLFNSMVMINAGDNKGAIVYQSVADTIGQVTDDTFLLVSTITDAMHHDESFCPQCKERKRRKFNQRTCDDCEKLTE